METNDLGVENPIFPALEETKESIELTKNSKGYGHKIKIKSDKLGAEDLKRLTELNKYLEENYGD